MKRIAMILGGLAMVGASWLAYNAGLNGNRMQAADGGGAGAAAPASQPKAKRAAPGFSLAPVQGNKKVSLADYKGKVVLVNFWATWCPPCRQEVPDFVKVQQELRGKGFEILGLSVDENPQDVITFMRDQKINYPVAIDNGNVAQAYGGVDGIPTSFLIDRQGKIVQTIEGAVDEATLKSMIKPLL